MSGLGDRWLAGDAYEAYMGRWSRPLARRFIAWLEPMQAAHWLEVGCGTGACTDSIASLADPASVVASDPSAPFIEHARASLADARVSFVTAGVESLPRRHGGFDIAVSSLALNFFPDPAEAIAAMRTRLCSGGTIAACVWDYGDGMALLRCFWDEASLIDPRAEALDEGRRFPLCQAPALTALFRMAGLSEVATEAIDIPTEFASFDDYWTPFLHGTGPAPSFVASLDSDRRAALRDRLRRRLTDGGDGPIRLQARAWAVRGVSR